jgi:hypothetical protein
MFGKKAKVTLPFRYIEDLCPRFLKLSVNFRLSWRRCTANRPGNNGRWLILGLRLFSPTALASAADISCLEICSRTATSRTTWSVIMKVVISRSIQCSERSTKFSVRIQAGKTLYMGPAVRWKRESAGTAVCVRDAFYNVCDRIHLAHSRLA